MATQELKETVRSIFKTIELVEQLLDGFQIKDIDEAIAAAKSLPAGLKGIKEAFEEYASLSETDAFDMKQFIGEELDLEDDAVETVIEQGFKLLIDLHDLIDLIKKKAA